MVSESPRFLVALKPDPSIVAAVDRAVPGVPWSFARTDPRPSWDEVEGMLVGAIDRDLGAFETSSTPRLAFVQLIYTGADHFPFDRFPDTVAVCANAGAYAPFVAEHAVMLALAAAREVVHVQAQMRAHVLRPPSEIRVLRGRTALILGYGSIGRELSRRLAGFEMRVVGLNRTGRMEPGCDAMYPSRRLREALGEADVVFDARPLTNATRGTIGAAELLAMRPTAILVNVGRAATVDEEALYRHLEGHPEFRAAFDPWWEEDFPGRSFTSRFPLLDLPNFVGTPHDAGLGPTTEKYGLDRALDNVSRFFRGESPRYRIDRAEYTREPAHTPP
jgi:phosphoglycerate dehydrogenase-like enzyme